MTSLRLGVRLALAPAARLRTVLLLLASALAVLVLLTAVAAGRAELAGAVAFQKEMPALVLAAVIAIVLPCAVLVATVARLSAALRDRRLANLRLIGLTPAQTRTVAATETGVAAGLGTALGAVAWLAVRPLLMRFPPAGRDWDVTGFAPMPGDLVAVLAGVPLLVVVATLLPTATTTRDPLAVSRRADRTPPGWWRLVPLLLGLALCGTAVLRGHPLTSEEAERHLWLLFPGVALLGIGLVLVLPVLVRLLTRALTGLPLGAATRIAVRRLEAQPAGVARIIAALLVGLFLVTGARYVLVAFESTPQYLLAAHNVEHAARAVAHVPQAEVPAFLDRLAADPAVQDAVDLPKLSTGDIGYEAVVATCADLAGLGADTRDCLPGEVMWIHHDLSSSVLESQEDPAATSVTWYAGAYDRPVPVMETAHDLPVADLGLGWESAPVWADAVIPPELVGELPPVTQHEVVAIGTPGADLTTNLLDAGAEGVTGGDDADYRFVATMRAIIWTIAAVVLGVGLLTLTVAAIDRATQRRKEATGLRLVGLGAGVLRRAQALETAVPVVLGAVLAIGCGALAGAAYLTLDETMTVPWAQTGWLALAAVVGGLLVAALTTAAATPRIRADEIRAE